MHHICKHNLTRSLCLARPASQAVSKETIVCQKKLRVAINGFGRIGRNFLRCWEGRKNTLLDVVAINDSGGVKQAAHLLKYDSILGTYGADVKIVDDKHISVSGKVIEIVSSRDPLQLPWKAMNIDLVIEGTGVFIDVAGAGKHITVSCTTPPRNRAPLSFSRKRSEPCACGATLCSDQPLRTAWNR